MTVRWRDWTPAGVIGALRDWSARNEGRRPAWNGWAGECERDATLPTRHVVARHFGSWRKGMVAAGFVDQGPGQRPRPNQYGLACVNPNCDALRGRGGANGRCTRCMGFFYRHGREWTQANDLEVRRQTRRDELVAIVRAKAAEVGHTPTAAELYGVVWNATAARFFGSWNGMMVAAGLPPRPVGSKVNPYRPTREEIRRRRGLPALPAQRG